MPKNVPNEPMRKGGFSSRNSRDRPAWRQFIALLMNLAVAWPLAADAQQPGKTPRIGILNNGPATVSSAFLEGFRALGYTEGQNLIMEVRFANWKLDRLPDLAAELVALKVDVIVAGGTRAARAAKRATSAIPIVAISIRAAP
jgi:putative tryptophan/tyrosine transport system substrate-binding protein